MPAKGTYLLIAGGGGILLWAGLKGKSPAGALRNIIAGQKPEQAQTTALITSLDLSGSSGSSGGGGGGGGTGTGSVNTATPSGAGSKAAFKTFAMALLIKHGWPGQFGSFNSLEMQEAGWNANATNQSSGAYGIGQALGHGTANTRGTVTNQYGNYGTSDATCRSANSGNGFSQLIWTMNYIARTWHDPNGAWAHEQAYNWY